MPSSLATQLAQSSSLNSTLLLERGRTRNKHRDSVQSYLFSGREAVEHDLDSIYALGRNGFEGLMALDVSPETNADTETEMGTQVQPRTRTEWTKFEQALFSSQARRTDRTLLPPEEHQMLNDAIDGFLLVLGPHLMSPAAGKTLEWLVRRFRINEFNTKAVLALFLPYHESPHFVKMLSILKITPTAAAPFAFLKPYAEATKPLPRIKLVEEMKKDAEVARFVIRLLPEAKVVYRTLVAFWAATVYEFIVRVKGFEEGVMVVLVAGLLEPLVGASRVVKKVDGSKKKRKVKAGKSGFSAEAGIERDTVLSSYVLLAALSRAAERSIQPPAIKTIVSAIVAAGKEENENGVTARQVVNTLMAVCEPQDELGEEVEGGWFDDRTVEELLSIPGIAGEFQDAITQRFVGVHKVVHPMLHYLTKRLDTPGVESFLESLIVASTPSSSTPLRITSALLPLVSLSTLESNNKSISEAATRLLKQLHQQFPGVLRAATTDGEPSDVLEDLIIAFESASIKKTGNGAGGDKIREAILASTNADSGVRCRGVKSLITVLATSNNDAITSVEEEVEKEDRRAIRSALLARIQDTQVQVLEALYESDPEVLARTIYGDGCDSDLGEKERYLELLESALVPLSGSTKKKEKEKEKDVEIGGVASGGKGATRALVRAHIGFLVRFVLPLARGKAQDSVDGGASRRFVDDAFHRVVYPFLLHSKPRGKTAELVWGILREGESGFGWIKGCADDAGRQEDGEDEEDGEVERMRRVNGSVAEGIAENILSSPSLSTEIDTLLRHLELQDQDQDQPTLTNTNPHSRVLTLLVIRALLRRVGTSDSHKVIQMELAQKVVDMVYRDLDQLGFNVNAENEQALVEMISPLSIDRSVILKPSSKTTEGLLWVAVLCDIAGMEKGSEEERIVDWIGQESYNKSASRSYAYAYPHLLRSVYALTPAFASTFANPVGQSIKMLLFRTLFNNLGNDALLLLAGVWLRHHHHSSLQKENAHGGLGAMALLHASAFLEAHVLASTDGTDGAVDFQIVLPALLVALASKDSDVKKGAGKCIGLIGRISGMGDALEGRTATRSKVKFGSVYAFDAVYGSGSDRVTSQELQYLSPEDFTAYVGALWECQDNFAYDTEGEYVSVFHGEHLCQVGDKDMEKYQGNILCFLLSHINAITLSSAQATLLKIILPVANASLRSPQSRSSSSPSKLQKSRAQAPLILFPLLHAFADRSAKKLGEAFGEYAGEIAALSASVVFGFNDGDGGVLGQREDLWEVFCQLVKRGLSSSKRDHLFAPLRLALSSLLLEKGLWSVLKRERKVELSKTILDAGVRVDGAEEMCKTLLGQLFCAGTDTKQQVQVITQLLEYLRAELATSENADTSRASKRAKLDKSREDEQEADSSPFARIALLAEVLASLATRTSSKSTSDGALPSSYELITRLLDMLGRVMQWSGSSSTATTTGVVSGGLIGTGASGSGYDVGESNVTFVQQNLMAAVEVAASGVKEPPNLAPNAIRLDVLVDLIRVTSNPQTFHQALLLVANLARLAPESALRNIMPVFTFMGSNVFHRDDTYSFAVVQKTVDNIVPVMVASLKQTHAAGGLEMYIGAREFLRVFTDAANHIPKHRRTNFFAHLVDVLGPKEFLAPICLLLLEKSANKIIRGQGKDKDGMKDDGQGALALPTMLVHHYSYELQVLVLAEMLRESERLANRVLHPDNTDPTFLDDSLSEEHSASPTSSHKRCAQAIIAFVGHAAKVAPPASRTAASEGGGLSNALALLITLSTMKSGDTATSKVDEIVNTARNSMRRVLNVIAAPDFIDAVLSMISSEDTMIQEGTLDLLSIRLPNVSTTVRRAITPSVIKILESIGKLLSKQPPRSLFIAALNSVKSIGNTLCAGEENSITNLVPTIVGALHNRDVVAAASSALAPLPGKLGPRLIPHLKDIVSQAVVLLREGQEDVIVEIVNVLSGLLTSIPTFWSKTDVAKVIKLYLDISASVTRVPDEVTQLVKTVAKRVPAKALLPTLCEVWRPLELSPNMGSLVGYFDLLKRALRSSDRVSVKENLRTLFNIFLGAFGIVKGTNSEDARNHSIAAFVELVVKLNEPTFRPLFRRLYDWAFASDNDVEKKVMLCGVYIGLLDFFKALMNPYMSMLLTPLIDTLKGFTTAESDDKDLLLAVLETFNKSLSCDDGSFWRDEKIRQLLPSLLAQIPICVKLNTTESKSVLRDCLTAVAEIATDDGILKSINLDVLMHSRSEDARIRLFALNCSEVLWHAHGGKLLGFVAETATFIAECCEDENDVVARESFKLKDAVESVAGSINDI